MNRNYLYAAILTLLSGVAQAHFQLLLPEGHLYMPKPTTRQIMMPFTHPSTSGAVMGIEQPQALFAVHRQKRQDLSDKLTKVDFRSASNAASAYRADLRFARMGDHVLVLRAQPYLEESEDKYIQQISKTVFNVAGLPTDWDAPVGLETEILPLSNPYALYAGGSFSGRVLRDGQALPGAELEVELVNYALDQKAQAFVAEPIMDAPIGPLETLSLRADSNGEFTLTFPVPGLWGIAAIGSGAADTWQGKELSQDAVLWVEAYPVEAR